MSCDRSYSNKVFSPNGEYFVQVVQNTCGGGLSDLASDVIITKTNKNSLGWNNAQKNIFIFGGGINSVKPRWTNNNTLQVTYTYCRGIYKQEYRWDNIKVMYDKKCSDPLLLPTNFDTLPSGFIEEYIKN